MLINLSFFLSPNPHTPKNKNRTINGRCTAKTNKRTWNNANGSGILFSFDLKDSSGDIRVTAFRQQCDLYFDLVQANEVYLLSGGRINRADARYTRSKSPYAITLTSKSVLRLSSNEQSCPPIAYEFKKIAQLDNFLGSHCDVAGVIKAIGNLETVTEKSKNEEVKKRDLTIVDETKTEIVLTIWRATAINFTAEVGSVLIGRGVRVSVYNGITLSATANSSIEFDPNLTEAAELKAWWSSHRDPNLTTKSLTETRPGAGSFFRANCKNARMPL